KLSNDLQDQLGRYNRSLDMAARISRETTSVVEADKLLSRVADLICDEFNLYHAQVFLLDDISLNAVLIYSRGAIGRRLLEQKLKIQVDSTTAVGRAASSSSVILTDDMQDDNPLLADARSEISLPLTIIGKVMGVLDIYSIQRDTFDAGLVRIFRLLADQLAIAIQNTRQLAEAEQRLQQ